MDSCSIADSLLHEVASVDSKFLSLHFQSISTMQAKKIRVFLYNVSTYSYRDGKKVT